MNLSGFLFVSLLSTSAVDDAAVSARVESTLETKAAQIRQLAFDGDQASAFESARDAKPEDHFTVVLDRPVAVASVSVVTGLADGSETLDSGVIEVSNDGKTFEEAAKFAEGKALAELKGREIVAIRIKPGSDLKHPLAIREIKIDSKPQVMTFSSPVEYTIDVNDAPELKEWADSVARLCEAWYPKIAETLKSDGYAPPRQVSLRLSKNYNGVAMAGGRNITGSVKFFKAHPDDKGALIHETVHIIQAYRGRGNPSWLVEGVADHVRFFQFEPGKIGPINASRAHYNDSYRTSARFLQYLVEKYDPQIVVKLNKAMREGTFKAELFHKFTGKDVAQLDEEWRATLRKP